MPEIHVYNKNPKLPRQGDTHGNLLGKNNKDNAGKALYHYKEALNQLALAKWYTEQEES